MKCGRMALNIGLALFAVPLIVLFGWAIGFASLPWWVVGLFSLSCVGMTWTIFAAIWCD